MSGHMGMLSCVEWLGCKLLAHTPLSYPRRRVSSTLRPLGSIIGASGILDHPPQCAIAHKAGDDNGDDTASRSRGTLCPSLAIEFPCPPVRGRRECRVHAAPAVSRAIGR